MTTRQDAQVNKQMAFSRGGSQEKWCPLDNFALFLAIFSS